MNGNKERIDSLLKRIELLSEKQTNFNQELRAINMELDSLRYSEDTHIASPEVPKEVITEVPKEIPKTLSEPFIPDGYKPNVAPYPKKINSTPRVESEIPKQINKNIEKFIGENLINKIGIIILVMVLV